MALALGCTAKDKDGDKKGNGEDPAGSGAAEQGAGENTGDPVKPAAITVYAGRTEALIAPVLENFKKATGVEVNVKYADSAQLAAALLEEGDRSPADVFLAQDASTLGLLQSKGIFAKVPDELLSRVDPSAKSSDGLWVGLTGRVRVLAYNTSKLKEADLPKSAAELIEPAWKGRLGWAPENASFQSALSAMIQLEGKDPATAWVKGMQKNGAKPYPKNTPAVMAVSRGEVDVALVNHYYLYRLRNEHGDDFPVENHYFRDGKAHSLINVTGAAILKTSKNQEGAAKLIDYLLGKEAQLYFATKNYEFPLVSGVETPLGLPDVSTLKPPVVDLAKLTDLASAHEILRDSGALP